MADQAIGLTKTCSKCGGEKPRTAEYFRKRSKGGLQTSCLDCWKEYCRAYYQRNREQMLEGFRAARAADPEFHRARDRRYFEENREAKRASAKRRWAKADKELSREQLRAWKQANPEKAKEIERRRSERIKADPEAKRKNAAKTRKWRAENVDKVREDQRKRYHSDRGRHLAYTQAWRERNTETIRAKEKVYRAAHPEKVIADAEMRRARMLAAEGEFTGHDIIALIKAHGRACFYCQAKLKKYQVDHFIPLSRGGTNWPSNLVISCGSCNRRKAAKLPWEWQPHRFKEGQPPRP